MRHWLDDLFARFTWFSPKKSIITKQNLGNVCASNVIHCVDAVLRCLAGTTTTDSIENTKSIHTSTRRDYYWLMRALFLEVLTWFGGQKRLNLQGEDQGEFQGKMGWVPDSGSSETLLTDFNHTEELVSKRVNDCVCVTASQSTAKSRKIITHSTFWRSCGWPSTYKLCLCHNSTVTVRYNRTMAWFKVKFLFCILITDSLTWSILIKINIQTHLHYFEWRKWM